MHFKSLELSGFKSFADKTRLDFEPGVTAIVGPNGCGKSNVADAIRWVMGEQNARLLRGLRMEDVIFNGTDGRKPLGFAEVSLTLTGVDKPLSVDYNEITVTRRAFRSGEGQYLINKTTCRLKDIEELFMGTGIGLSAYSIIEQGKMDMILSSKPDDRRFIFEEAAGITKYKDKKQEALRKLGSTEENLIRLSDIIKEVKRQLASVERQAARARKAKEIADELKCVEIRLGSKRLADMDVRVRDAEKGRAEAGLQEAEIRKAIESLESEQGRLHERLQALDQRIGSVQLRRMGVSGGIEGNRSRIETAEKLVHELQEGIEGCEREIRKLEETLSSLRGEEESVAGALDESARDRERIGADLAPAERDLESVQKELREGEERTAGMRSELMDLINELARRRNELVDSRQEARAASLRSARLRVEQKELSEKIELARGDAEQRRSDRGRVEAEMAESARRAEQAERRFREARESEDKLREERLENEKALSHAESRYELLIRQRDLYEGYIGGVKAIMAETAREGTALKGIRGVVAEAISAKPGYERAVEVALGYGIQTLVSDSVDDAIAAVKFLSGSAGASFLPLEGLAAEPAPPPSGKGILGPALDFVRVEPAFSAVARRLLGSAYFVESLEDALELSRTCRKGTRLATRRGELLEAGGGVAVAGEKESAASPVSRGAEIDRLSRRLQELRSARDALMNRIAEAEYTRASCETSLEEARGVLRTKEIRCAESRTEEARAEAVLEGLQGDLASARAEVEELESVSRESSNEEQRLEAAIVGGGERQAKIEQALTAQEEESAAKSRELERSAGAVTELKIALAAAREKEQSRRTQLERLRREIETVAEAIRNRKEQGDRMSLRRTELIAENESLQKAIDALVAERDSTDTDARKHESEKITLYERQKQTDSMLKDKIASMENIKDLISKSDVALAQYAAERANLIDRIRDQYGEDLAAVSPVDPGMDLAEMEQKTAQLKEKLARAGAVNMGALEEHDELAKRLSFLTEQEADLLSAKESLVKAISRINTETTRMFSQTFQAIRAHFKEIFKELFGGGNADLVLEEGASILEAGIDIVARPHGKTLQNISLLSGGERALTAVALLFAIFKVKPSPFCVLDEIDAPLDESNIDRFLKLVEKFLQNSQFIIVTHNKRTISMADVMYGITMEESGVSKVVSVKFSKGHKKVSRTAKAPKDKTEVRDLPAPEGAGEKELDNSPAP